MTYARDALGVVLESWSVVDAAHRLDEQRENSAVHHCHIDRRGIDAVVGANEHIVQKDLKVVKERDKRKL
jgi:hypothetical protein